MILIDYSSISIRIVAAMSMQNGQMDLGLIRHTILNNIRLIRQKFKNQYGEVVICCDGRNSWRKKIFPEYKANRKKNKEDNKEYWNEVYFVIDATLKGLIECFPYKVVKVDSAEADDVVAILAQTLPGPHLVVATDKDYIQLQKIPGVAQYNPRDKDFMTVDSVDDFIKEHIIRGDKGDGVPNVLSEADTFITPGKRQKTISKKMFESICSANTAPYLDRNIKLISLFHIPNDIKTSILKEYEIYNPSSRGSVLGYLISNKLKNLVQYAGDF